MEKRTIVVAPEREEEVVVVIAIIHQTARAHGALGLVVAKTANDRRARGERRSSRVSKLPPWQVQLKPSAHGKSLADGPVQKASVS